MGGYCQFPVDLSVPRFISHVLYCFEQLTTK